MNIKKMDIPKRNNKDANTKVSRTREVIGIVLMVVAVYLSMVLWSYSAEDSAWTFFSDRSPSNIGGSAGAWLADIMFTAFGCMAWLFVGLLLGALAMIFFRRNQKPFYRLTEVLYLKFPSFIVLLLSSCALSILYFSASSSQNIPASAGGIAGSIILELFLPTFGIHGATLFLVALAVLGFTLLTNFSWILFADFLGKVCWVLCKQVGKRVVDLFMAVRSFFLLATSFFIGISKRNTNHKVAPLKIKKEPIVSLSSQPSEESILTNYSGIPPHKIDTASVSTALLDRPEDQGIGVSVAEQQRQAALLEEKLKDFGVDATVVAIEPGPVVTRFEIQPAPGLKVSKISGLATDLARSLSVERVRVVEVIPGKSVVGIEIPNSERKMVYLSEVMESNGFMNAQSPLSLVLGQTISGEPMVVDLAKMPHLLVAGTTGSGKSVGVNAMILSLLYKASPAEVRLILVDPKMLELSVYEGIPHLLTPVVTDMKEAAGALRWCVMEMERRYQLMSTLGVRNISGFNEKIKEMKAQGAACVDSAFKELKGYEDVTDLEPLPFIVVVIDEFADMMMIVGKKVENLIARIAQKARAAGIHLVLATQRPSVDVITGLIKANIPSRISFQVSSKIDSRTVIDQSGAEQLLGQGDMLYLPPGSGVPIRVHGAFVSDRDVHQVVADWKARGEPEYLDEILNGCETNGKDGNSLQGNLEDGAEQDELYDQAVEFVIKTRKSSVSAVQRQFRIGYNRAANIVEHMEASGILSAPSHNGIREILVPSESS